MKVIGAGLPRTATLSQKVALEMLGQGPCYHMVTVLADLSLADNWQRILTEGGGDFESVFAGFQATVDWPGAFFYNELLDVYPEAKVLLSVRDGASWEASMTETVWGILYGDTMIHDLSSAWSRVDPAWREYLDLVTTMWEKSGLLPASADRGGPGWMAEAMERYNQSVIRSVPSERLLVWRATDGWAPLCEFLDVPVPAAPFPRVNDAKMFAGRIVDASLARLNAWQEAQRQPVTTA